LKKTKIGVAIAAAAALTLSGCAGGAGGGTTASEDLRFVNVVKLIGVGWFDRMDEGIVAFASDSGIDASQTGADDASPEKQVRLVEDLIAQGVDAITVVPNSPESLEGVFQKARDAGIVVVTHEAASQKNTDADIEAFDNTAYGETIMDNLAESAWATKDSTLLSLVR